MRRIFLLITFTGIALMLFCIIAVLILDIKELDKYAGSFMGDGSFMLAIGITSTILYDFVIAEKLRKNGTATTGTIIEIKQTNLIINKNPQFEFTIRYQTKNNQIHTSKVLDTLTYFQNPSFMNNMTIPIRYNPQKPNQIVIDCDIKEQDTAKPLLDTKTNIGTNAPISPHSIITKGVVTKINPTGKILANNPEITLTIKITNNNNTVEEKIITKIIPQKFISNVQIGSILSLHYLPEKPDDIFLVF